MQASGRSRVGQPLVVRDEGIQFAAGLQCRCEMDGVQGADAGGRDGPGEDPDSGAEIHEIDRVQQSIAASCNSSRPPAMTMRVSALLEAPPAPRTCTSHSATCRSNGASSLRHVATTRGPWWPARTKTPISRRISRASPDARTDHAM